MEGDTVAELTHSLVAAVEGLQAADLSALGSADVTQLVTVLEVQRRKLAAVDQRVLAEVGERGLAGGYAAASTTDLLVALLRITPAEAKARVAQAGDLGPRRTKTGEPLPPILPAVAAAVLDGEISAAHASVITRCLDAIPPDIACEMAPVAERFLVEAARHEHPRRWPAPHSYCSCASTRTGASRVRRKSSDGAISRCIPVRTGPRTSAGC